MPKRDRPCWNWVNHKGGGPPQSCGVCVEGFTLRERCERCGEEVHPDREVWLELSTSTGLFTDPKVQALPEDESQGGFCFGQDCATAVLKAGGELHRIRKGRQ